MGVEETHECGACHHRSSPRTPDGSLWQCPICGHTNFIREPGEHPNEVQAIPTQTLAADDEGHPDHVATKALSHGELGNMLFGLEEPSEEKLPWLNLVIRKNAQVGGRYGMISNMVSGHLRVLG